MERDTGGRGAPTSRDVAALAGVSQSTVSYVMSGKRAVAEETRRRVEAAMRQLTYQPNAGARALRGKKTNVIALVVHLGENVDVLDTVPYIETIVEEARRRDYDVVLVTTNEGPAGLTRLAKRSVCDAFVLMDIRREDERIETAASLGLPVVLMGTPQDLKGLNAVDFNSRRAGELLVDELADCGHRYIVLVGDSPSTPSSEFVFIDEFQEGCRRRAAERGLPFSLVPRAKEGWAGIEEAEGRLLAARNDRLGLIARTPQVAEWLLQLARLNGLVPGRDISIVALCSDAAATSFEHSLTNVSTAPKELSRLAMQVLFDLVDGVDRPSSLQLIAPSGLIRRSTSAVFS